MYCEVMVRLAALLPNGKQNVVTTKVQLPALNMFLRSVQDSGNYILGVIPLFREEKKDTRSRSERLEALANELLEEYMAYMRSTDTVWKKSILDELPKALDEDDTRL